MADGIDAIRIKVSARMVVALTYLAGAFQVRFERFALVFFPDFQVVVADVLGHRLADLSEITGERIRRSKRLPVLHGSGQFKEGAAAVRHLAEARDEMGLFGM